jgi:dethiobiotin synthetase
MRLFVTGTDTDVGKSVVTACLAQAARHHGSVRAAKPVASGVTPGTAGDDATLIAAAAGHLPIVFATFAAPLSPHRAARLEGRTLPASLLEDVAALTADTVLVEGVGGWRVPLGGGWWNEDVARAAGARVVVVAADRLGVLNHTLLTVDAVRRAGLHLAGVVLNRGAGAGDASRVHNLDDLRELTNLPVAVLPSLDPGDEAARDEAGRHLWRAIVAVGAHAACP